MKKLYLFFLFFAISFSTFSQIHDPVKWITSVEKVSETEFDLVAKATIGSGWHLYAQNVPDNGPIPTTFVFDKNESYEAVGETKEGKGVTVFDTMFEMTIKYFENRAVFKQRIKLINAAAEIKGFVEFSVCNEVSCLPPKEVELSFNIPSQVTEKIIPFDVGNSKSIHRDETKDEKTQVAITTSNKDDSKKSLLSTFIIAFLFGFTALLTPCVFPMIPMTVSFFTKQSKNKAQGIRNAIVFGISIIVIYVLLGTVVTWLFGASALNALSTNVWFNVAFFFLLVIFALSFLGAFELTLPSSWGTKVDAQADRGGLIGIFFMALALAIVSFSCTGPIVGSILVESASGGNQIGPIIGMLGFSLAIALPFTLFAAFPGWMNSLPKSGGWLNTVKVVLGFLELAFAFKFLSNADLVLQLHLLEREVFLAIWIAIFGVLSLYLFGKITLPHDSPVKHISVGRLMLGLLSFTFTIYMLPGLWGAPLNLISAFPPAQHYSESPYGVGYTKTGRGTSNSNVPDGAHLMAPHDIVAFNDYDKGLAYAKKIGKPIMIDFTGYACVNCRKMEQNVWAKDKVLSVLKNDVVLISLYVDDKRKLEGKDVVTSKLNPNKKLKYIGQKWSELQTIKYKTNSQPFYVLMNHDESNLIAPIAYTPEVDTYYNWLKEGVSKFKKKDNKDVLDGFIVPKDL